MRFHVLALPHTVTSKAYSACAFTQKVLKFCTMMHSRGHTIIHYGHERSEVDATECVSIMTDSILEEAYGTYNWHNAQFKHNTGDKAHVYFNRVAADAVAKRKQPGDFLLCFWGCGHSGVAEANKDLIVVEPGIGSYNNLSTPYAVFESYAVMHWIYGKYNISPRFMDCVVPNYFDVNDFIDASDVALDQGTARDLRVQEYIAKRPDGRNENAISMDLVQRLPKDRYVLMIARLIPSKGIQTAIETCAITGHKLVIIGQGQLSDALPKGFQVPMTEPEVPYGVTHLGYAEPYERAVLIANAKCLMAPTLYAEPFGGVNVEAQMSGLPVITTDWGAFAETVLHNRTGFRCRSMDHFTWSLRNIDSLDRRVIRHWAASNYGLTKIATMYEEYFAMLQNVHNGQGFYEPSHGRLGLRWLEKEY
jgi:glycosyltransferase involved in cell wall biosynthesis